MGFHPFGRDARSPEGSHQDVLWPVRWLRTLAGHIARRLTRSVRKLGQLAQVIGSPRYVTDDMALRWVGVEPLELRILLSADLSYTAINNTSLTLGVWGDALQLRDTNNLKILVASELLTDITAGVNIDGNGFDIDLITGPAHRS